VLGLTVAQTAEAQGSSADATPTVYPLPSRERVHWARGRFRVSATVHLTACSDARASWLSSDFAQADRLEMS